LKQQAGNLKVKIRKNISSDNEYDNILQKIIESLKSDQKEELERYVISKMIKYLFISLFDWCNSN
jgi:hypothetical protein